MKKLLPFLTLLRSRTPVKPDRDSAPDFYNPYRVDKTNPFDPSPPKPYKE